MEIGKANTPSYGWRSMMAAKELLGTELRRTIGTGEDTRVWSDMWIPDSPARPAVDNGCYRDPDLQVHHLINPITKQWDLDLIHAFIAPADIPKILSIRPSRYGRRDSFCWEFSPSGQYTVRSGYRTAESMNLSQEPHFVSDPSTTSLKKQVWKIKTTRKIKHFIWQALSGCVATTSNLTDRHCGNDRGSPRCGAEEESTNHLLFECPPAMQCWALSPIPASPGLFPSSSLFSNLDYLFWRAKENGVHHDSLNMFPWLIWYIWKARNEKVFNGKEISPLDTIQLATHEAESWRLAQIIEENKENLDNFPEPADQLQSSPPPAGPVDLVRCQVDASWRQDALLTGLGFVATRGCDDVLLLGLRAKNKNTSPLHAELEGLIWAMQKLIQHGIFKVHFESDCLQMIKLLHQDEERPLYETEFEDFHEVRCMFQSFSLAHIPRQKNVRADWLAKGARSRELPFSFINQLVPHWLGPAPNLFATA